MESFENIINNKLLEIWEKNIDIYDNEIFMPIFYSNLLKENLLFVGINPSFNTLRINNIFKCITKTKSDANEYFKWVNRESFSTKLSTDLDDKIRVEYPYFKKYRDIAEHIKMEWEHIDMFHNRTTSQNKLKEIIFSNQKQME